VAEGDRVEVGQILFEVETDKAAVEVEAVAAGRVARIVAAEGEIVPVLAPVAYLAESDADVDAFLADMPTESVEKKVEAPVREVVENTPKSLPVQEKGKASPAARKIAQEGGIDLGSLGAGAGPGGRILSTDVPEASGKTGNRKPMNKLRRAIALGLQKSKQTVPHFYMERSIDAAAMLAFCKESKKHNPITVNELIVYACGVAVGEFAAFRSRVEGDEIVEEPSANIGVAVQTETGLMVPVVEGVEKRTLQASAAETKRVVEAAKAGKLYGVGTAVFTVSNLGMLGVERFSAIINPPESAILAVGAAKEVPVVSKGQLCFGVRMIVTLSADHRVIDGVVAAKFLARLKELLEAPEQLAK